MRQTTAGWNQTGVGYRACFVHAWLTGCQEVAWVSCIVFWDMRKRAQSSVCSVATFCCPCGPGVFPWKHLSLFA